MRKLTMALPLLVLASFLILVSSCKKDEENNNPTISSVTVNPASVVAGGMVMVTVAATDPDGDALTYTYTVSGGAIAPNGASASWTAPSQAGAYSVTVNVSDGNGGTASSNGALTVVQPPTQIQGTASFPAGTSGDLSNSKVSIYTSYENWEANSPIEFTSAFGAGSAVEFTLVDINPGNYYLDVWKDNDNDGGWSPGDFVGWWGSGGLGSPNLTEIQIAQGQTINVSISMWIIEEEPVVTAITGTATIAGGGTGDLAGSVAYLYNSYDDWNDYNPLFSANTEGTGTSVTFAFEGLAPGDYLLDVWKDADNSGDWTIDDWIGLYGDIGTLELYWINIEEGQVLDFDIEMYLLVGKNAPSPEFHQRQIMKR